MRKQDNKTFVVDCDTWKCESFPNRGVTYLRNEDGYKCCLGFVCEQAGVKLGVGYANPRSLSLKDQEKVPFLVEEYAEKGQLTFDAIEINDDGGLKIETRTRKLRKLFKKHGFTMKFKNLSKYK